MNQSQAITEQRNCAAAIANVHAQITRLQKCRAGLADQLAQIDSGTANANAENSAACAALSAAITAHALGEGSADALDAARARANRAAVAIASLAVQRAEGGALLASISDIDCQLAALAQRHAGLCAQGADLIAKRLREKVDGMNARLRSVANQVAAVAAEARAMHWAADSIGKPGNYAGPYLHMPAIVMDALGGGDRIVIDMTGPCRAAAEALAAELRAEGFNFA